MTALMGESIGLVPVVGTPYGDVLLLGSLQFVELPAGAGSFFVLRWKLADKRVESRLQAGMHPVDAAGGSDSSSFGADVAVSSDGVEPGTGSDSDNGDHRHREPIGVLSRAVAAGNGVTGLHAKRTGSWEQLDRGTDSALGGQAAGDSSVLPSAASSDQAPVQDSAPGSPSEGGQSSPVGVRRLLQISSEADGVHGSKVEEDSDRLGGRHSSASSTAAGHVDLHEHNNSERRESSTHDEARSTADADTASEHKIDQNGTKSKSAVGEQTHGSPAVAILAAARRKKSSWSQHPDDRQPLAHHMVAPLPRGKSPPQGATVGQNDLHGILRRPNGRDRRSSLQYDARNLPARTDKRHSRGHRRGSVGDNHAAPASRFGGSALAALAVQQSPTGGLARVWPGQSRTNS